MEYSKCSQLNHTFIQKVCIQLLAMTDYISAQPFLTLTIKKGFLATKLSETFLKTLKTGNDAEKSAVITEINDISIENILKSKIY